MNSSAAILNRLIDPQTADLSLSAARSILRLKFAEQDHLRMEERNEKAQNGELTSADRDELAEFLRVADILAILQSKARRSLKRVGRAS